jgi:polysaccharide biosynthesis transport protein
LPEVQVKIMRKSESSDPIPGAASIASQEETASPKSTIRDRSGRFVRVPKVEEAPSPKATPEEVQITVQQITDKLDTTPARVKPLEALVPSSYYGYPMEGDGDRGAYSRLHDYFRSARKHVWLISAIMLVITTLAAIYLARQPDVYEAKANVQVDLEVTNPALGSIKSNSLVLNAPSQDPTYFNTQMQILTSASLLGRVVKTLDLEHNRAFLNPQSLQRHSTLESLKRMIGLSSRAKEEENNRAADRLAVNDSLAPATSRDDIAEMNRLRPYVEKLQNRLSVKQVSDTRLIEIRFNHPDPQTAAKVINAIVDAFAYSNLERKTETSGKAGDFLQKRIIELQSEIRRGEETLINYAKNHQIISLDPNQNTVVDRLSGLNKQLLEAENERKMAEAAYRASLAPGAAEALAEGSAKQASEAETKLVELWQKRADLLVEYTERVPEIKQIDEQIVELDKQAKASRSKAVGVVTTNLTTAYRQALAREQSLRASFNQQRGETLTQNEAAVNYRIIQQEIETNKGLLEGLLQRAKENDVLVAGTPNNIHVVDYATVPTVAVGPRRLEGIGLAILLSFVVGIALARYLEYLDDTIHSSDDVEKQLHLPALAVIPAIGTSAGRRLLSTVTALQKKNGNGLHGELLLNSDARSPLAEAYRHLRTSILLSSAGGAPQTLLIASSQPSEGKTTTAVNTALILEQTGAKVLVVDADMRRPRLHSIFDLDNQKGLSSILASKMGESEMLGLIDKHEESGVYVLTSGRIPPNPAELIGSDMMQRLMTLLKGQFTHIILDSPPIASFTDSVLISSLVDGVLLVVHGDHASRTIVRRSRQVLQDVGGKIFGVVLNNVTLQPDDYYYHNYHYQKYYQAEEKAAMN